MLYVWGHKDRRFGAIPLGVVTDFREDSSDELVSKPGSRFGQEGTQDKTKGRALWLGKVLGLDRNTSTSALKEPWEDPR